MTTTMVRYKIKTDRVAENERFISEVFEQLKREQPPNLHYASFKLEDGISFMHIASREDTGENNPLGELAAFKAFISQIQERCEEPPVAVELKTVGSYHFLEK